MPYVARSQSGEHGGAGGRGRARPGRGAEAVPYLAIFVALTVLALMAGCLAIL